LGGNQRQNEVIKGAKGRAKKRMEICRKGEHMLKCGQTSYGHREKLRGLEEGDKYILGNELPLLLQTDAERTGMSRRGTEFGVRGQEIYEGKDSGHGVRSHHQESGTIYSRRSDLQGWLGVGTPQLKPRGGWGRKSIGLERTKCPAPRQTLG